jgi:DNA-binding NtrC family response regulator
MKSARIFLVEDDLSFGSVLKSYLELNDFQVDWVDDGKYALIISGKGHLISAFSTLCFRTWMVSPSPVK